MTLLDLDLVLENLLDEDPSLGCECIHGSGTNVPNQHCFEGQLASQPDTFPCSGEAIWIVVNPNRRENKRPFYVCKPCGEFWGGSPFRLTLEALK